MQQVLPCDVTTSPSPDGKPQQAQVQMESH